MVSSIRVALTLSSLVCVSVGAHGDFQTSFQPFKATLDRHCPAKHLDLMTPADLNDRIDPFLQSLPQTTRQHVTEDPKVKHACEHSLVGVSCQNIGYIDAIHRRHLLDSFAQSVCKMEMTCHPGKTGECHPSS